MRLGAGLRIAPLPSHLPCHAAIESAASILAITRLAYSTNAAGVAAICGATTNAARGRTGLATSRPTCSTNTAYVTAIRGAASQRNASQSAAYHAAANRYFLN